MLCALADGSGRSGAARRHWTQATLPARSRPACAAVRASALQRAGSSGGLGAAPAAEGTPPDGTAEEGQAPPSLQPAASKRRL